MCRGGMLQGTEGKFSPPSKAADKWRGRCAGEARLPEDEEEEGRGRGAVRRGGAHGPAAGAATGSHGVPATAAPPRRLQPGRVPPSRPGAAPGAAAGERGRPTSRECSWKPRQSILQQSFPRGLSSNMTGCCSQHSGQVWELQPIRWDWCFLWKSSCGKWLHVLSAEVHTTWLAMA